MIKRKINSLLVTLAGILLAVYLSGCGYATAAKIVLGARNAGDAVAKGMAAQTRTVTAQAKAECTKEGKLDLACYKAAIKDWRVHRERFRTYAVPAINSTVAGGYMAVKLAKEAEAGKAKANEIAMGVLCTVAKMVKPFLPLIAKKWQSLAAVGLTVAEGMACK